MAETSGGRVLGHVPAVHYGKAAVVGTAAGVDLSCGGAAAIAGTAAGVETAAGIVLV